MLGENSFSDHKAMCSTIALLQERFRQLQRVKEMREEKELLKLISPAASEYQCGSTARFYEPSSANLLAFQSELVFPTKPPSSSPPQLVSLSLWPTTQIKQVQFNDMGATELSTGRKYLTNKSSWLTDVPLARSCSIKVDDPSDVDTTLHL